MNKLFKVLLVALFVQNVALLQAFIVENRSSLRLQVLPHERESRKSYIYLDDNYPKFPMSVLWRKPIPLKRVEIMWLDKSCDQALPLPRYDFQMMENEFITLAPGQYAEIDQADEIEHCYVYVYVEPSQHNTEHENSLEWEEQAWSAMDKIIFEPTILKTAIIIPKK